MSRARPGITLVEVVVVLVIVGMLAGVTGCLVVRIQSTVRRTACLANLRVIGLAFQGYAADHRRRLPADSDFGLSGSRSPAWFDRLPAYIDESRTRDGSVFQCPAWRMGARRFPNSQPRSLKMNGYLDSGGRPRHYRLGSVSDEQDLVLMIDGVAGETGMGQWGHAVYSGVDDSRHRGRANHLSLDGAGVSTSQRPADGDWSASLLWISWDWR
jgi:prepilin-type N-terminal cleavage/methylation domain-containing protein